MCLKYFLSYTYWPYYLSYTYTYIIFFRQKKKEKKEKKDGERVVDRFERIKDVEQTVVTSKKLRALNCPAFDANMLIWNC